MTTINPVPMTQTQAPAFRGKTTKAQQKFVDTANKAFRDFQIKEMMKTDPERAKVMIMQDMMANGIMKNLEKMAKSFIEKTKGKLNVK